MKLESVIEIVNQLPEYPGFNIRIYIERSISDIIIKSMVAANNIIGSPIDQEHFDRAKEIIYELHEFPIHTTGDVVRHCFSWVDVKERGWGNESPIYFKILADWLDANTTLVGNEVIFISNRMSIPLDEAYKTHLN